MPKLVAGNFHKALRDFIDDLLIPFDDLPELAMVSTMLNTFADEPEETLGGWNSSMMVLKKHNIEQPFFTDFTPSKVQTFLELTSEMHPILRMLPLGTMWNSPRIMDDDRMQIWNHLQTLESTALTINSFNVETLNRIEDLSVEFLQGRDLSTITPQNMPQIGFEVIQRVFNDPKILELVNTPEAQSQVEAIWGKDGHALNKFGDGGDLGSLLGSMKMEGVNPGQLMGMMGQMQSAIDVADLQAKMAAGQPPDLAELMKQMTKK